MPQGIRHFGQASPSRQKLDIFLVTEMSDFEGIPRSIKHAPGPGHGKKTHPVFQGGFFGVRMGSSPEMLHPRY